MNAMNSIAAVLAFCPICGKPPDQPYARGRDFEYATTGETEWTVKECEACEVLALSPRPSEAELARIYPANYYAYDFTGKKSIGYMVKALLDRRSAGRALRSVKKLIVGNATKVFPGLSDLKRSAYGSRVRAGRRGFAILTGPSRMTRLS